MTLNEIYKTFSVGSAGFVDAVATYQGFGISNSEIERIAEVSPTAEDFQNTWENEDFWTDENN